jgi:hypothetical protein
MRTKILELYEAIEETYEFMLTYADQDVTDGHRSPEAREFLNRAVSALHAVTQDCAIAIKRHADERMEPYFTMLDLSEVDVGEWLSMRPAPGAITSQMAERLDPSFHFRTLITNLFLLDGGLLKARSAQN